MGKMICLILFDACFSDLKGKPCKDLQKNRDWHYMIIRVLEVFEITKCASTVNKAGCDIWESYFKMKKCIPKGHVESRTFEIYSRND